ASKKQHTTGEPTMTKFKLVPVEPTPAWVDCSCENCGDSFKKKAADLKRTNRNFCSKSCSGKKRASENISRFYEKCEKSDGCWNWLGKLNKDGYGVVRHGSVKLAH